METDPQARRDEALSFLVNQDTGILATASTDGKPSARLLYYTCDDSFNVYFLTLRNTRKAAQLAANPHAAFVVTDTETPRTLQMEGTVEDLSETATNNALVTDFIGRLMAHKPYGIPLEHFDSNVVVFYKLSPTWIRWGDFTFGTHTDEVMAEVDPAEPPV